MISVARHHDYLETEHSLLAVAAGQPVGFILTEPLDDALFIVEVAVHQAWQQQGIGGCCWSGLSSARQMGCPAVTLTTFREVPWNAPFYTRLGFAMLDELTLPAGLAAKGNRRPARPAARVALRHAPGVVDFSTDFSGAIWYKVPFKTYPLLPYVRVNRYYFLHNRSLCGTHGDRKRIAQFILDDVAAAAELPIAEIARLTQTSQASVTRFARALGCKDVRELKMKLAQSLAVGQRFILDVPDLEGVQGICESIISVLETNRRALDIEALKARGELAERCAADSRPGDGRRSTICAQEIQYRLFRLGLPVVSQSDGLLVRMMSSAVTPQDVVIVLSLGGYTREIIESAAIASQYGAKVIAITPPERRWLNRRIWCYRCWYGKTTISLSPALPVTRCWRWSMCWPPNWRWPTKPQAKGKLRRIKLALDSHRGGVDRQPLGTNFTGGDKPPPARGYVPRPVRRDKDRCPDRHRRTPPVSRSPDFPASRRRPPAPEPPAATPLSAREYSPRRMLMTERFSAIAPRHPVR